MLPLKRRESLMRKRASMTDELGHVFELDHFELVLISRHVYEQVRRVLGEFDSLDHLGSFKKET